MTETDQHTGDGETGVCHICQREFSTQEELSKHLIEAHDDETLADDETRPNNEDEALT